MSDEIEASLDYETLRNIQASVSEEYGTERNVENKSYIKLSYPTSRNVELSLTTNTKTLRNTLLKAMQARTMKKHITLENLCAFLMCLDTRFVQQQAGYGLSSNDFTDRYKERIRTIEPNAERNVITSISVDGDDLPIENREVIIETVDEEDIRSIVKEVKDGIGGDGNVEIATSNDIYDVVHS